MGSAGAPREAPTQAPTVAPQRAGSMPLTTPWPRCRGILDPAQVERPGGIDSSPADSALGVAQYPFPGQLDEVRVSNRGRSAACNEQLRKYPAFMPSA
jgi:hypothetical protein